MRKSSVLGVIAMFFAVVMSIGGLLFAADPWQEGRYREINKKLGSWSYPKAVGLTGTSGFVVDVTDAKIIMLDTTGNVPTGGASIFFTGTNEIPTHTIVYWHGTGQPMMPSSDGYSPIAYNTSDSTWPFGTKAADSAANTYVLKVVSGIQGPGEVTGTTIYVLSGTTLTQ